MHPFVVFDHNSSVEISRVHIFIFSECICKIYFTIFLTSFFSRCLVTSYPLFLNFLCYYIVETALGRQPLGHFHPPPCYSICQVSGISFLFFSRNNWKVAQTSKPDPATRQPMNPTSAPRTHSRYIPPGPQLRKLVWRRPIPWTPAWAFHQVGDPPPFLEGAGGGDLTLVTPHLS